MFREIIRVLKPGGRMLVSDIVAEGLPDWIVGDAGLHGACIAGGLTELDYLGAVRAAGLAEVTVVDRVTYDDGQLRALIDELLPTSIACLGTSRGMTSAAMLEETTPRSAAAFTA